MNQNVSPAHATKPGVQTLWIPVETDDTLYPHYQTDDAFIADAINQTGLDHNTAEQLNP
jgi:hypothetical protein